METCSSPTPVIVAYNGCPAGGTVLKCSANARLNGEEGVCNGGTSIRSRVVVASSPGTTIWVRMLSGGAAGTTIAGTVTIAELAPAANDTCANAAAIFDTDPPTPFDTNLATNSAAEVNVATACPSAALGNRPTSGSDTHR